jgi:hypothetical protein
MEYFHNLFKSTKKKKKKKKEKKEETNGTLSPTVCPLHTTVNNSSQEKSGKK